MASLLSWGGLAQRAKALAAQVNPLDNGRTYNTVMQNLPPPQAPPGVRPASGFQQLTHSGLTNTVGNMAVKPFVVNPLEIANEAIRQASAGVTGNQAALNAANTRQFQNLKQSVPGWLVQQADNAGAAGYNLAFKAPILDLKGNAPAAEQARTVGLNEFNRTAPGQLTAPLQRGIAALGHASNAGKAQIGLDPNATFAQKFIGDPVVGGLGTLGAAKGIEGTGKAAVKGGKAVVAFDKAQNQAGFVGGSKAPGFAKAKDKGLVFNGAKDGKPRFEVSDKGAELKPAPPNPSSPNTGTYSLGEVLHHPELYKQYPGIEETRVKFDPDKAGGSITPKAIDDARTGKKLDLIRVGTADSPASIRETLLHEIQHSIQGKENFARGSSSEIEKAKLKSKLWDKYDVAKRDYHKFVLDNGGRHPMVRNGVAVSDMTPGERLANRYQKASEDYHRGVSETKAYNAYRRSAGEAEARNVELRSELSQRQINRENKGTGRHLQFNETFDVKPSLQHAEFGPVKASKTKAPAGVPLKLSKSIENSKLPGAFKRAYTSATGVISGLGEGGREIAKRVGEQRFQSETRQAAFYKKIPTVMKLNKDQFRNFVDTLDNKGKAQKGLTLHPDVAKAVGEWQKAIVDIPKQAGAAGIDMGNLGKNYFPRIHKDLFATGKGEARMLDKIIEQQKTLGKDINRGDATAILNKMRKGYNKEYGNLTKSRTGDLPGYEKTHDAMTTYIDKAFGHITHAEQFGPKGELLKKMIDNISRQGHDVGADSVVGKHLNTIFDLKDKQGTGYKVSSGIRNINAYRSLSSAAISNATQLTNTVVTAGAGRTAKGIFKLATSKEARDRARASGVLIDHAIKNLSTQQLGVGGRIARNVASPFFGAVEKFNRETTAIVGHDYGNHLAAKAAKGNAKALDTLRNKFGIEGPVGKTLTEDQSMKMSSKLVEISQFKVDPQDLPNWVDSPLGKLAAQFRTFGYKQTGFMWNQVLREAQKGNFLPLGRFIAVGVPGGVASASLKAAVKGQAQPQTNDKKKLALSGLNAVGGFGLPGSAAQSVANGNKYGDTLGAIGSFIGGPTAGFADETRKNIANAQGGKSKGLIKEGVRSIPAVGPFGANKTMPTAPAPLKPSDQTPANASPQQKVADTKAEKKALEADPNVGNGDYLRKLPDGQYAYYVDGDTKPSYTKDIKTARNAIAENSLKQSGDSYKVVGETVYRKGADGTVTPTTKTKFDYQIGTQMLEAYKNADDLNGWMATASDQIASIDKQLKDPSIDPLDQITLENDKASLQKNIDKYTGYGGFTKGKKAKSAGSASFKTASSTSIPRPKGISVRVSKANFKAPATRKLSVSKLPSNYLNKKLS